MNQFLLAKARKTGYSRRYVAFDLTSMSLKLKLAYSRHAKYQMEQRNISSKEVEIVARRGTAVQGIFCWRTGRGIRGDKLLFYRSLPSRSDNPIAVVLEFKKSYWLVVTVMHNFTPDSQNWNELRELNLI